MITVRKIKIPIYLINVFFLLIFFILPTHYLMSATVFLPAEVNILVDANATSTSTVCADAGYVLNTNCFRTIQAGVNAASSGQTVGVNPGTYNERVTIVKSLTLLGSNKGIDPNTGSRDSESVITKGITLNNTIDGLTIDGFKFTNGDGGSVIYSWNQNVDNVRIINNFFENIGPISGGAAVIYTLGSANTFDNWEVSNNRFINIDYRKESLCSGMNLWYINNLTVNNNYLENIGYHGLNMDTVNKGLVTNNTFKTIKYSGVQISNGSTDITVSNNYIENGNRGPVVFTDGSYWKGGITLYNGKIGKGSLTITNNTIIDSYVGLSLGGNLSDRRGSIFITENTLKNNSLAAIFNYGATGTVDIIHNYFGDITGPKSAGVVNYNTNVFTPGVNYNAATHGIAQGEANGVLVNETNPNGFTFFPYYINSEMTILSDVKEITDFTVPNQVGTTIIDQVNHLIYATTSAGTDLTSIIPTITYRGYSVNPNTGTSTDFTLPVTYTVTSYDRDSTQTYTVTVVAKSAQDSVKEITNFTIPNQVGTTIIDQVNHLIYATTSAGTDLTSIIPTITYRGYSITPGSGVATNFTAPVVYTVTSYDQGSTQTYTVTVTVASSAPPIKDRGTPSSNYCTYTYSDWSECVDGEKTRTATGNFTDCNNTPDEILTKSCTVRIIEKVSTTTASDQNSTTTNNIIVTDEPVKNITQDDLYKTLRELDIFNNNVNNETKPDNKLDLLKKNKQNTHTNTPLLTSKLDEIKKSNESLLISYLNNLLTSKKTANGLEEKVISPEVTNVVTTAAAFAGSASVASAFIFNPIFSFDIFLTPIRLWNLLLGFIGLRRKNKPWGVVYDSVTKQPLDPVYVLLLDENGKEFATSITDLDGRYGFLAPPGKYKIVAHKTNYVFPSKKLAGKAKDEIYNDLYFGEYVTVKEENEVIYKNIPLDPEKFDWNEFMKKQENLVKFYSKREHIVNLITKWLFRVGFVFSFIAMVYTPIPYNIAVFSFYILLIVFKKYLFKNKTCGSLKERNSGNPLSFSLIRVMDSELNIEIVTKVANKIGKYYCLVPKGRYYIKIEKKVGEEKYDLVYTSRPFDVDNGIINKDFLI